MKIIDGSKKTDDYYGIHHIEAVRAARAGDRFGSNANAGSCEASVRHDDTRIA